MQQGSIYEEILLLSTKNWSFLGFQCIFKQVKTKRKIFRQSWTKHLYIFHFSAQFVFTTSETELDYYHQKVNVWVVSRVAKRLNTYDLRKLGSFKKISEMLGYDGEYPAVHRKAKFCFFFCKKLQKMSCKTFHRKTYFAYFPEFVSKLSFKIVDMQESICSLCLLNSAYQLNNKLVLRSSYH